MEDEAAQGDDDLATVAQVKGNYQRLVRVSINTTADRVRLIPEETWGSDVARCFAWDIR